MSEYYKQVITVYCTLNGLFLLIYGRIRVTCLQYSVYMYLVYMFRGKPEGAFPVIFNVLMWNFYLILCAQHSLALFYLNSTSTPRPLMNVSGRQANNH